MWSSILFGFLAGLMGANAVPHFVKGITRERYPCVFGNSPITNVVAGWFAIVIAAMLWSVAGWGLGSLIAAAIGALVIGVFHAAGGAYRLNDRLGATDGTG